jgi:hypothetical protein
VNSTPSPLAQKILVAGSSDSQVAILTTQGTCSDVDFAKGWTSVLGKERLHWQLVKTNQSAKREGNLACWTK